MSSTNKTTYYELSQYIGSDKPTYLGDYNSDMLKIDTAIHDAATDASTAVSTANAASSAATTASTNASAAVTTANAASATASEASNTAGTALTNAGAALTAAQNAENKAKANDISNLAPAYDSTLTYGVGDLVTYVDENGTGKLYRCIVPVTNPMAFNINYWDDVTTNEIYNRKAVVLGSVEGNGTLTIREILNELHTYYDYDINSEYILKDSTSENTILTHEYLHNSAGAAFSRVQMSSSQINFSEFNMLASSSISFNWTITTTGTTFSDSSTSFVPAAGRVFSLIKLATI